MRRAYMVRGIAWSTRRPDKAIDDYTKSLELDPKLTRTTSWRGQALCFKNEFKKAIADLTEPA